MNPSTSFETLSPMESFFAQYGLLLLSLILVVFAITAIILISLLNRRDRQGAVDVPDENAFKQKCDSLLDEIKKLRIKLKGSGTIKEDELDERLRTLEKTVIKRKINP